LHESLSEMLDDWTLNGLVTADQAQAIREHEASRLAQPVQPAAMHAAESSSLGTQEPQTRSRAQVMGEVLGYVGGILAIAALIALGASFWEAFGRWGQFALTAGVTAACVGGGWVLGRGESRTARRLASFLIFLGTWSFGLFVAVLEPPAVLGGSQEESALILMLAFSTGIWWFRRTSLQLIAMTLILALWVVVRLSMGDSLIEPLDSGVTVGISFLVLGVLWAVAAEFGWIAPPTTAWALGSLGMVAGVELVAIGFESSLANNAKGVLGVGLMRASAAAEAFGVVLGLALIVIALWRRRGAPLGFGAAAVVLFVPQLLNSLFDDSLGISLALLVTGVLFVIMSVVVIAGQAKMKTARVRC